AGGGLARGHHDREGARPAAARARDRVGRGALRAGARRRHAAQAGAGHEISAGQELAVEADAGHAAAAHVRGRRARAAARRRAQAARRFIDAGKRAMTNKSKAQKTSKTRIACTARQDRVQRRETTFLSTYTRKGLDSRFAALLG